MRDRLRYREDRQAWIFDNRRAFKDTAVLWGNSWVDDTTKIELSGSCLAARNFNVVTIGGESDIKIEEFNVGGTHMHVAFDECHNTIYISFMALEEDN